MKTYSYKSRTGKQINLSQEELTLGQHLDLVPIFMGSDAGLLHQGLTDPKKLLSVFSKKDTVFQVMRIIFKTDLSDDDMANMPDRIVWEVMEDFLSFNPGLRKGLMSLLSGMISSLMQTGTVR